MRNSTNLTPVERPKLLWVLCCDELNRQLNANRGTTTHFSDSNGNGNVPPLECTRSVPCLHVGTCDVVDTELNLHMQTVTSSL